MFTIPETCGFLVSVDLNQIFISPLELRSFKPRRRQLETALDSYEALWREYSAVLGRVERLEARVDEDSEVDRRLRGTLLAAEDAAETYKAQARSRSEETLKKARKKADEIIAEAERERLRLEGEIGHLRRQESEMRAGYLDLLTATMDRLRGEVSKLETPAKPEKQRQSVAK